MEASRTVARKRKPKATHPRIAAKTSQPAKASAEASGSVAAVPPATARSAKRGQALPRLKATFPRGSSPLLWADCQGPRQQFLTSVSVPKPTLTVEDFQAWLMGIESRIDDPAIGLECIAWAHWLDAVSGQSSGIARELPELLDGALSQPPPHSSTLARLWLRAEFPLTLAVVFPSLISEASIRDAVDHLQRSLSEACNATGWQSPDAWSDAVSLFASWTRCGYLCRVLRREWLQGELRDRWNAAFRPLLRGAIHGTHRNGTSKKENRPKQAKGSLASAAMELAGNAAMRQFAKRLTAPSPSVAMSPVSTSPASTSPASKKSSAKRSASRSAVGIAEQSEAAQFAFLRDRWGTSANRIDVQYRAQQLQLNLQAASSTLLFGSCDQRVLINGHPAMAESGWEHVCWHSDEEADYLELELRLRGCRIQRQLVLARKDAFALIADAVTLHSVHSESLNSGFGTQEVVEWSYELALPLASGCRVMAATDTREVKLGDQRERARAMLLSSPEWRIDPRPGEFTIQDDRLVVSSQATGRGLYLPVLIDLNAARIRQPLTWRRLTVAENLTPVAADEAVAFRAQVGDCHWLVYRELGLRGNRTFFGKNVCSDFFVGRFLPKKRDYETIVEIE